LCRLHEAIRTSLEVTPIARLVVDTQPDDVSTERIDQPEQDELPEQQDTNEICNSGVHDDGDGATDSAFVARKKAYAVDLNVTYPVVDLLIGVRGRLGLRTELGVKKYTQS